MTPRPIRFVHQDRVVAVQGLSPTTTVLQWLRESAGCMGTKEGCAEGDCGACTIVVAERSTSRGNEGHGIALYPINACMRLLPTLDGKALFTVDDLRRLSAGQLHPVQQALVDSHASQCGFCTPGFAMTLFAGYEQQQCTGTRPSRQEWADALAGNLCRCTGYRPILDAAQRMHDLPPVSLDRAALLTRLNELAARNAADDGANGFHYQVNHAAASKTGDVASSALHSAHLTDSPQDHSNAAAAHFFAPRTVEAFARLCLAQPEARILAGTTDIGIWINKQMRDLNALVYVGEVEALRSIDVHANGSLRIGAAASLEEGFSALTQRHPELLEVWLRFASPPVRHAGTLVGNLANGSPIGDGPPVLLALDAELVLQKGVDLRRLPLSSFYLGYMSNALAPGEFIAAVEIPPLPGPLHTAEGSQAHASIANGSVLRVYKLSKRFDSDISSVCAALRLDLEHGRIVEARFAFGGMAATAQRAQRAEGAVLGLGWTEATVRAAMAALARDFTPLDDLRGSAAYRQRSAANLLMRFWLETRADAPLPTSQTRIWPMSDRMSHRHPATATEHSDVDAQP